MRRAAVLEAAYMAVLAMDQEPSRRTVQAMAKAICGKALQTADVLVFLRSRPAPVPLTDQASTEPVPPPVLNTGDPVPPQVQASTRSRERADHKGVSKIVPYVQGERKGTSSPRGDYVTSSAPLSPPPEQPALVLVAPEPPEPKADRRSPAQQVADDALALLRDAVSAELDRTKAMTWTAWRSRNRRAATSLAAAGRSAQEIAELHAEVSEREGRTVLSLAHLQTSALYGERESPEERRRRLEQEEWDRTRPPTVQELIAAGTLPPMPAKKPLADVVPIRHAPNPQIAAFAASFGISL